MLGIRWGVGGGGGGMPFLISIIIRLLTLACRCLHGLSISGAALDDAEHTVEAIGCYWAFEHSGLNFVLYR